MIIPGIITVLALIVIFMKFNRTTLRRILGYDIMIDIVVTAGLAWLLAGTFSGMMAALVGGLLFSLILWGLKWKIGSEKLRRVRCPQCQHPHLQWV